MHENINVVIQHLLRMPLNEHNEAIFLFIKETYSMIIQRVMKCSLPLIVISILLTGFNSSAIAQQRLFSNHYQIQHSQHSSFSHTMAQNQIESKLLAQYSNWKNVKYLFGGTTKKGIDCSAFVQTTYQQQFGIHLPRTTLLQRNIGKKISKDQLQAGDLIFFNIKSGVRHIGIYLGNNQFMHSGCSHGVSISNLDNSYWIKRFAEVRRVLATNREVI